MPRIARAVYFWSLVYSLTIVLACTFLLFCAIPLFFHTAKFRRCAHGFCTTWARIIFALTPGWHVTVIGKEFIPKDAEPFVIVCNHESPADIWVMYRVLGIQFRWIAKHSLFKIPFFGRGMKWAGYVPVERGNKESHSLALRMSRENLEGGFSMFYFPEGTIFDQGEIGPFKIGAFKLASEMNVPILPMTVRGTTCLLKDETYCPGRGVATVEFMPLMRKDVSEDLAAFRDRVHSAVSRAYHKLGEIRNGKETDKTRAA